MKKYLPVFLLLFSDSSFAQFHLAAFNNNISNALAKVVEDFPGHFNNIRGEIISKDVQAVNYASLINIQDADSAIIIQNGDDSDNIYSWKQTVFETDDFGKAKAKFHEYFTKVKATAVTLGNKKINFQAAYNEPAETKRFATILFSANPETEQLKDVVLDLSMQYVLYGWQITISVYEHKDYGM